MAATDPSSESAARRSVYQVSELAEILRGLLEDSLSRVWIEGEISNLARPTSGHWYFTLKDARAQLRSVMFKGANFHFRPPPKDGDRVLVRAQVSLYAARGDLQLICEHMEPAGQGALLRAFEQLKARLAAEGLFDEQIKRPIPAVPRHIGLITSGTGAAVQDILSTLARRFPLGRVTLYPVPVQGAAAAPAMIRALQELPQRVSVDVIILARGGGSLEDLWAFNDEALARAIRACPVPVVSGVGHEIDFTIADFAADLRAPTPTGAAERVSPDLGDWVERLLGLERNLLSALNRDLRQRAERIDRHEQRLRATHPGRRLLDSAQRLDDLSGRLMSATHQRLLQAAQRSHHLRQRLLQAAPLRQLASLRQRLDHAGRLQRSHTQLQLQQQRARLARCESLLASLNPRAVLERGYAIAINAQGQALQDAAQARSGETLKIVLARGSLDTLIQNINKED
jgi:exodeoxyribonuclease VII large subunit